MSEQSQSNIPVLPAWYVVMIPSTVLNAAGAQDMRAVANAPTIYEANQISAKHPGSWIILNVLLHVQPTAANLTTPKPQ